MSKKIVVITGSPRKNGNSFGRCDLRSHYRFQVIDTTKTIYLRTITISD